jgi:hypothetical protein
MGAKIKFWKSSRVFLQKYSVLGFSRIFKIILLKKKDWENIQLKTQGTNCKIPGIIELRNKFSKGNSVE